MKKYYLLLILLLVSRILFAESGVSTGFGISVEAIPFEKDYKIYSKSIPRPYIGGDFYYYAVTMPIINYFSGDDILEFGVNGVTMESTKIDSVQISETKKNETTVEVSVLNFYSAYLFPTKKIYGFSAYFLTGPSLTESLLTSTSTTYTIINKDDGTTFDQPVGTILKNYSLDYSLSVLFGGGFDYLFESSNHTGFKVLIFYGRTNLVKSDGDKILSGSGQIAYYFLFFLLY